MNIKFLRLFIFCIMLATLCMPTAQAGLIERPDAQLSTEIAKKSFPTPFNGNKALALLFSPPSPNGEASWQPSPAIFAQIQPNPGNALALTKAIGFKSYDYDETKTQVMFLYKTTFPKANQPLFQAVIGAALFNCENGICKPVWNNPALNQFASYEDETETKFVSIGQGCHGAIMESGDTHQGITVVNAILLAVHNNQVVVAAKDLPIYEDNEGATDDPGKSYKFSTKIEFKPGEHKRYHNMKVQFSGTTLEDYEQAGKMLSKVVPANFFRAFYWDDQGFYEEEIDCGGATEDLPANADQDQQKLEAMLPIFDSVIRVIFSGDRDMNIKNYSSKNANLTWSILYHIAVNHGDLHPLIKVDNDAMHVPSKTMQEFASACFADYQDLVSPPRSFEAIKFNNAWNSYDLQLSDSGPSYCKVLQTNPLGEGTYSVNVGFYDDEEEPLSATFVFIVKPNPYAKNISDALFSYSVESVKRLN